MDLDFYITLFSIVFPIIFGVIAVFFLIIGMRGILTRRPFLLSNRWLLSMMFIIFVPNIILPLILPPSTPFLIKWLNPVMFTVVLVMMCFVLKGYVAFGVTDTSFRDALLDTLQKLELSYEESLSAIRITSVEVDLQVSVQSWIGSGIIKIKQRGHLSLLTEIVTAMNEYFRVSATPAKLLTCIFYMIMGVIMVIAGIGMSILFQNIT